VIAVKAGQMYALELKTEAGYPSAKQVETMQAMQAAGAIVALASGLTAAIRRLEEWGLLIGEAQS
jgi:hypothetical protein